MADRYWRGGTGTWDTTTTTNWSTTSNGSGGASVPTAADNVIFDQAGTYTVTMTGALACLSITVSAGTVTFATGTTPTLAISGGMSLIASTVWSSTGAITFNSTTSQTITTNAVTINGAITFNGVGGNWSLGSALTTGATLTTTLTNGTVTLNGFTLTTGIFSSSNSNSRAIAFGSNNIVLAHTTAATTVLDMANVNNFTYTGTGGFTTAMGVTRTFTSGTTSVPGSVALNGTTQYASITSAASGPLDLATGAGDWTVECWFYLNNVTTTQAIFWKGGTSGTTNPSYSFAITNTQGQWIVGNGAGGGFAQNLATVFATSTWYHFALVRSGSTLTSYVNGVAGTPVTMGFTMSNTSNNVLTIGSSVADGSTRFTAGNISNFRVTKGVAVYTGNFTVPASPLTISQSSGTNISATTASQTSLLLNTPNNASFLTDTSINAFTVTNNGTATASATAPVTTVNATLTPPKLALTSGASIPTFTTGSFFDTLTFTGSTSTPAVTSVYLKNLTLASGGTYTNLTPTMVGTGSINSGTNTTLPTLTIDSLTGTTSLASAFTMTATGTVTLTSGTLALNGFVLTTGIFSSSVTTTRAITFGSTNIVLAHTTAATTVLSMATATGFTNTGTGGFAAAMSVTRTFTFGTTGGTSANAPNLFITSGASIPTITTAGWFNKLDFTGSTCTPAVTALNLNSLTLASGGTYTNLTPTMVGTGAINTATNTTLTNFTVNSTSGTTTLSATTTLTATSTVTLTSGTLDLGGFVLSCGIFSSSVTNTRAIAFGSTNINLTHTTAATTVLSMATLTGFTYTGTGGFTVAAMSIARTFTCGTTGGTSANAPSLTFTSGASVPTLTTGSWFNLLDFGTTSSTIAATTLNINSITLSTTGTYTALILNIQGTGTLTGNSKTTAAITLLAGTLTVSGTVTCTTFTVNGPTFNFSSGTINPSTSFVVTSGGFTYGGTAVLGATPTFTQTAGAVTFNTAYALTATGTYTLTAGTLTLGANLTTGIFSSSNTNTRSIAFGANNIILATTTLAQTVLNMATATGFTYTSSGTYASGTGCFQSTMSTTRTFVFGTTGGTITNAPTLYLVSGASVATITTGSYWNELNFGTTAFTIAATTQNLNSLYSASSTSVLTALTANMLGTGTIRTNTSIGPLTINSTSGTTTLQTGGTSTLCTTCALTSGTLDINGQTLTCSSTFTWTGGSLNNIGALNCTTFTLNGPTFNFTSGTVTPSTSFVVTTGSFTYNGGTLAAVPTFTHTAGTVRFNVSYALTATGTYTFTAGTLSINDSITLSTGIFSSTNTNTRTINFGLTTSPGYIALTHTTAATTVLSMAIVTGLTVNALGKWDGTTYDPTQVAGGFRSETTVTRTFTCGTTGGNSANAPCLYVTGTGATQLPTFTTGSWFGDFNIYNLSTMTIAATTLNINSLYGAGYYFSLNTTSMSLNFVGSGFIRYQGDTNNTFGILGTVTINHSGTTAMIYAECAATTVNFTSGTLECRYWVNGPFSGYGQFKLTGVFTQTGGTWYGNAVYISSCTTYTVNGPTISFDSGSITATTSMVLTTGSFTFNGGTISAFPAFTHTAGTVRIKNSQTVTLAATATYTFTAGSLILEDAAVLNTGIFSSSGTGTRAITFGTTGTYPAVINLTHTTAATTVLSMATATGFTWTSSYDPNYGFNAGFQSAMANTRTFVFGTTGGSITNSPNLRITGSSTPTITTGSWFNILDFSAAQSFTLPATSLNLNSLINGYAYNTVVLTGLTANMRGPGFLLASSASSIGPLVINNSGTTQLIGLYPAPTYGAGTFNCTTLTITAGNFDGGVQKFTGSCTAGVLTTTGSPTLVPGSVIYNSSSIPDGYAGTVMSGSGNSWVLGNPATSFSSQDLWVGGSQAYPTPATLACSSTVTWTGGTLTNFGSTTAYIYGDGKNSITWTCTTFTINGPTFNHTLQNGGTINPSTSFVLTSGSYTYNGGVLGAVPTFTHTAGTATFNYNYSLTTTGTYTLTAGTLTLATGVTLGTGIFSSTGAGTRAIGFGASITSGSVAFNGTSQYLSIPSNAALNFGTGDFTVEAWVNTTSANAGDFFIISSTTYGGFFVGYNSAAASYGWGVTGYTWDYNTGATKTDGVWQHIAVTRSGTSMRIFVNGVQVGTTQTISTAYDLSLGSTVVGWQQSTYYFPGYISNLRAVKGVAVYTGNFTVPTTPLTATQSSGTNISAITGTQTSLLLNTVKGAGFLTDSSTYNLSVTNNNAATSSSLNPFVGVVNLTHTTAATVVLNMAALGGFSYTGSGGFTVAAMTNTRTFSVGNTSGGSTTTAPNLYFTSGASVATLTTGSWYNNLDFGATSFNPGTTALNIDGDLTLSSSGTYTGLTVSVLGTSTVTTNGKTIVALTIGSATLVGTATLAGAATLSGALTLTQGSLDCSTYAVQSATFASTGTLTRSMTGSGTYTITGSGATAFSNASTGITITGLIISMTAATAKTFAGGGGSYSTLNQGGAGALTIADSNSFADLTATTRPSTITFTAGTTQTFADFTLSGTAGNLVTINSTLAGTQATLSKSSGAVSVGYLSIRDSNATGGATWQAGATSTNVSNNTGWVFGGVVYTAGGNFFLFF